MRHHPKSNNGVFSKKQKKASRMMMANKFTPQDPMTEKAKLEAGIARKQTNGLLSLLMGKKMRRKAS